MKRKSKYSPAFERDWAFYLHHKDVMTFSGQPDDALARRFDYSPVGLDAKACFWEIDVHGRRPWCCEPELLTRMLQTKAAWNLQIKLWAHGKAEGTLGRDELEEYMAAYDAPPWVLDAITRQALKMMAEALRRMRNDETNRKAAT